MFILRRGLVLVLSLLLAVSAIAQEDTEVLVEDLDERAARVTLEYPWLLQTLSGLSVTAQYVPREEFVKGLTAATDVQFEGVEALPEFINFIGRYRNLDELLRAFCRENLDIDCEVDVPNRIARFRIASDSAELLSDTARIARYRRAAIDPNLIRRNFGMHYSGVLILDGSIIPPPVEFQIEPMPAENRVVMKINGYPVTEVSHLDSAAIDRALFEATNLDEYKAALQAKLDYSWRMTTRIPLGTSRDMLNLFARQSTFIYGVVRSEPTQGGIRLHLMAGTHYDWAVPKEQAVVAYDPAEAYVMVQAIQNQVVGGLSLGGVVFLSNRFGVRVMPQSFDFNRRLNAIVSESIDLAEKERKIRFEWREEAEWVLEYFYTSLISTEWAAVPLPVVTPITPPVPSPTPFTTPSDFSEEADPELEALIQSYIDELDSASSETVPPELVPMDLPITHRGLQTLPAPNPLEDLPFEEGASMEIEIQTPVEE